MNTTHRIELGSFTCLVIKDGSESRPRLSDYVASPPDELKDRSLYMLGGVMLVETPEGRILIDAGDGPHRGPRTHEAEVALQEAGVDPQSIATILLTHGDPDHIGGLLTREKNLVYPNARYVLHRELWDAWQAPPSAGLYFPQQEPFVRRLAEHIADRSDLFDTEEQVRPGITAIPALGHRAGHSAYLLEADAERLLHIGDAAFDPLFLEHTDLINAHDTRPEEARDSRRMLVRRALAEEAIVVGTHFEPPGAGTLQEVGTDRYSWSAIPCA